MQQHSVEGRAVLWDHWWDSEHPETKPIVGSLLSLCLWVLEVKILQPWVAGLAQLDLRCRELVWTQGRAPRKLFKWHHRQPSARESCEQCPRDLNMAATVSQGTVACN